MQQQQVMQMRQDLNKQALLNIMKCLAASGKEGKETAMFYNKLRKEDCLNIDMNTYKELLAEVAKVKQGGLGASTLQYVNLSGGGAAGAGAPMQQQGGAGHYGMPMQQEQPQPKPAVKSKGPGGGAQPGGPQGATKPKGVPKAAPKSKEPALPPYIGFKVERYWEQPDAPGQGSWYSAYATDYDASTGMYTLTYSLGTTTEEFEQLALEQCLAQGHSNVKVTGEKVNLRDLVGKSSAVANSMVLREAFAAAPKAAKSKKRKSDGEGGGPGGAGGGDMY